ncbi:MAG: TetR/AcrR family transcriptional regulator [Bacteroidales bacterium]|nr:TetR/AcrR family transcriptional regulator [Bacteroidales bacterium]
MNSKQKWLEEAYDLFGEYGPDGLNIKLLAEKAGLPRTNFYYHFADKEDLIEQLLHLHNQVCENYCEVLRDQMRVFLPDMHKVAVEHQEGFKFHRQLFLNRNDHRLNLVYINANNSCNPVIIPKLIEYYKLNVPYSIIESLWTTVTDTWYSRLDVNNFNVSCLCGLTEEIMKTVLDFAKTKLFVNSIKSVRL